MPCASKTVEPYLQARRMHYIDTDADRTGGAVLFEEDPDWWIEHEQGFMCVASPRVKEGKRYEAALQGKSYEAAKIHAHCVSEGIYRCPHVVHCY